MSSFRYRSWRCWLMLSAINTTTNCYYVPRTRVRWANCLCGASRRRIVSTTTYSHRHIIVRNAETKKPQRDLCYERGFFERRLAFWVVHKKFHPQKIFESIIFAHFLCGARRPDIPTNITEIFTLIFLSLVNMEEFRMTQIWEHLVWLQRSPIAFWEPLKKLYLGFLIEH